MAFNVDVDELENSHGATYVRKKAAKVTGENQTPKEQGYVHTSLSLLSTGARLARSQCLVFSPFYSRRFTYVTLFFFAHSQGDIKKKRKKKKGKSTKKIYFLHAFKLQ